MRPISSQLEDWKAILVPRIGSGVHLPPDAARELLALLIGCQVEFEKLRDPRIIDITPSDYREVRT